MSDELFAEFMRVFREEAEEYLDRLENALTEIGAAAPSEVSALTDKAMRIAHSLKGAANTVGLNDIGRMAHALEDALEAWRHHPESLELGQCQRALVILHRLLEGEETSDADALLTQLNQAAARLSNAPAQSRADQDGGCGSPLEETRADGGTAAEASEAAEARGDREDVVDRAESREARGDPRVGTEESAETAPEQPAERAVTPEAGAGTPRAAARPPKAARIRVETARLDAMMSNAADLVALREDLTELQELSDGVVERLNRLVHDLGLSGHDEWQQLLKGFELVRLSNHKSVLRLAAVSRDSSENVRRMRLVPLGELEPQWRRIALDAAQRVGRRVRLLLVTPEVTLDTQLRELLRDPIVHLIRNAASHGIESPETRKKANKAVEGTIAISATVESGFVVVAVDDDGRGLDLEAIRRVASQRGGVGAKAVEDLSESELVALIFEPGFSTCDSVGVVSGRGVGLDVVRDAATAIGGRVEASRHGRLGGASFRVYLPMNLLSTRAAIVLASGRKYAIPALAVERILRVPVSRLNLFEGTRVLELGDEVIRVRHLDELLGATSVRLPSSVTVVVVESGRRKLGILVDDVDTAREVVVKRLPWYVRRLSRITGATTLPGGALALFLDVTVLMGVSSNAQVAVASGETQKRILVVDDSHTIRTLTRAALSQAGYEVEVAADGAEGWQMLQKGHFDLLVTDIQMPTMDGFELTRLVRDHPKTRKLPVLLVTSRNTREDIERGVRLGADEYIVKGPLQNQKLLEAIGRTL